jgi:hypothetical protein
MNTVHFGLKAIDPDLMRVVKALNEVITNQKINEDIIRGLRKQVMELEKENKYLRRAVQNR